MCARGNGHYCGVVIDAIDTFVDSRNSFGTDECNTIVGAGFCLGSIVHAVETGVVETDDDGFDPSTIVEDISSACTAEGVSGVSQAAASTEAPADLASSAASGAHGSPALVAAVATSFITLGFFFF